jgi:hypothetical protein
MTCLASAFGLLLSLLSASARDATLMVTVLDPSGAVVPLATVTVRATADGPPTRVASTSEHGVATFPDLVPGPYAIQADFSGFDPGVLGNVDIRPGERKRVTVTLVLQKVEDTVTVSRDAQTVASDPRGSAFGSILTREEIDALSEDPTELAQQLLDAAGGAAVIRVDGFNGGTSGNAIPPKALIKSIRIARNRFAAEHHSPDFDEIEIVTQPGLGPLRGGGSWRWRDGRLSGRSPFATTRGPERTQAWQANLGGTLVRNRASFSLSGSGTTAYDTPILNVALPGIGDSTGSSTRAQLLNLRRPSDGWGTYDLFDYAITPYQLLRAAYVENGRARKNLGVGDYDLPERAYASDTHDRALRLQESGPLRPGLFASTRFGLQWRDTAAHASQESPTIRVLDAFTSGGAQVSGGRHAREMEFATDIDYTRGQHAVRAGLLIESGRFRSDESANYLGTYTFSSLAAYVAGEPASYTQRVGDPSIAYWNVTAGAYLEDDLRIGKSLTLSPGVRYERQSHVPDRTAVSPRLGITWAPFKRGQTTLRLTYGFFYDWLSASTYEQTLRLDGARQQELTVVNPTYPFLAAAAGENALAGLPTNRYLLGRDLTLATTQRVDVAIDQAINAHVRTSLSYYVDHDAHVLRARNLNAPTDGVRPNPAVANVLEAVPDAEFRGRQLQANLTVNPAPPGRTPQPPIVDWRRGTLRLSYTLSRQENNWDGPFSVPPSGTLATEWGPAGFNRRHRVQASITSQAVRNLTAVVSLAASTGTPYTITTGTDDNGDAIFNDRPAGVGRNTERMPGQYTLSANLAYAMAVGNDPRTKRERCRLTWTLNAMNVTNHANYAGVSGVLTSPFFGRPTTVQNPRKIDLGMSITF